MTVYDDGTELVRYDLDGSVVARAKLRMEGWVITDPDGGESDPITDTAEARERLIEWDHLEAAREELRRARAFSRAARTAMEDAIRRAHRAGVPQTQIAEISGFSRQWVRHLLQR